MFLVKRADVLEYHKRWALFGPGSGTNGTNGDKKARLDPACGTLVFCGATDFANMLKPGKLKEVGLKFARLEISNVGNLKCWKSLNCWMSQMLTLGRSRTTRSIMSMSRCLSRLWRMWGSDMLAKVRSLSKSATTDFEWMLNFSHLKINTLSNKGPEAGHLVVVDEGGQVRENLLVHITTPFIGLGVGQQRPWSTWPGWHQMQVLWPSPRGRLNSTMKKTLNFSV